MPGYQHTYLIVGLLFLTLWLVFWCIRPDLRREMTYISLLGILFGPLGDMMYTQDWWKPLTLAGNPVGLEASLAGFSIAGVASASYEVVFGKRLKTIESRKKRKLTFHHLTVILLVCGVAINYLAFFTFGLNSLLTTILFCISASALILYHRHDLLRPAIASGALLTISAVVVYTITEVLTPGWVKEFWLFRNVPSIIIYNLPIDDIIFYFLTGFFLGPLYEFWQQRKIATKPT